MKKLVLISLLAVGFMMNAAVGQISYIEEVTVSNLNDQYISQNRSTSYTLGYRVQIFSSTDRRKMEAVKDKLLSKFPNLIPVWTYEAPNYKLRVGAFKTKMETEGVKHTLSQEFPSVFAVKDNKIRPIEYL